MYYKQMPTKDPRIYFQTSHKALERRRGLEKREGGESDRNIVYGDMENVSLIVSVIMAKPVILCFILCFHHGSTQSQELFLNEM